MRNALLVGVHVTPTTGMGAVLSTTENQLILLFNYPLV